ncbi:bifunctional protein-serine/threonine kinase/phosphatase [Steroidobacter agaridevorans]|uniref:bifunctional protein-serine/threonine kinase/phosphatase n=1 Tax=Steroidobacter agaridevorans TaxID=2695856 RepID=UPI00132568D9|nr:bifunctional protein-serine/threonine kinase/phosphatase [Steroidobacter agaridevorans]GFE86693.1 protein kinase [Steroidobacter agaridevorans]
MLPVRLKISLGQHSDRGRKEINQDFHGACIPDEPQLTAKGIAVALADGVSSSNVSQIASEATVKGFLEDYYCTSPAWSVRQSAQRVLMAINSWLYAQTRQSQYRYDQDRGYVCTLSALVIKSTTAHIFHVGDSRIYRLRDRSLEQLTQDHRLWISREKSYLGRALGVNPQLEIDYSAAGVGQGDVLILATDGIHEYVDPKVIIDVLSEHPDDLDRAAKSIADKALEHGSDDNLTIQLVRVDAVPQAEAGEIHHQLSELPLPPELAPRMEFDGYRIIRSIRISSRSHVHLATDLTAPDAPAVVIKTPSVDLRGDPAYLERFLLEDWIARRIDSPHVVRACAPTRKRNYLYTVTEFIDGQTLTQWMIDNPKPKLSTVRGIVQQIAKGLQAFHRLEMLHQDLRPENIMIDATGTVKIMDFGSTRVAGIVENAASVQNLPAGTAQYTAPEYFLGDAGTSRSDLFSLGVITYQMLTGRLSFGTDVAQATTKAAQRRLMYRSLLDDERDVPAWIDETLKRATHPDPVRRYQELSEFVYDLSRPNEAYLRRNRQPLLERHPVMFWKTISAILTLIVIVLLAFR